MEAGKTTRTLWAFVPLGVLIGLLALSIAIFGADSILGPSQVALLAAAGVAAAIGMLRYRIPWKEFEDALKGNVGSIGSAVIILLLIGAISGTWMMSGVVPAFVCYGIKIISPKVFLLTACVLCAIVSVMTGSSWTTIATVGVALLGIGRAEGFSDAMTAGAIISGAYFGDKVSPLSDTTVLASSINRVPLFDHIKYMMVTTIPSFTIALIVFTFLGLSHSGSDSGQIALYTETLTSTFHISPWLMVVPLITVILIWKRLPALVVLALSVVTAAIAALIFQPDIIRRLGEGITEGSATRIYFAGTVESIYNSVSLDTGSEVVNPLVATRGMLGMLNTVFLILSAMCFGAALKASGMIADLARLLTPLTKTRTGLVSSTVVTGASLNGIVSDQYLSIILTSSLYGENFDKEGYERRLLSRSVEDSSTVTSPLFLWSSCGMTQATILAVPTLIYAPYCLFNILSPLMSILIAAIGFKIKRERL